jgi:hypothetical protein
MEEFGVGKFGVLVDYRANQLGHSEGSDASLSNGWPDF